MAASKEHRLTNHLRGEASPYLLQHMRNPVDWYPWGDEALARARSEGKPIFLSIGYSTCHWCHVMEKESFGSEQIAALLNEDFISIKVDREERPDIDHLYMTICQMMTGSGGWPLTLVTTPEGEPFFAATYVPKSSRFDKAGLLDLIPRITRAWKEDRARVEESARGLTQHLRGLMETSPSQEPTEEALHRAYRGLKAQCDPEHGGFGRGVKFPTPHNLLFLLRYAERTGTKDARAMALHTLASMRRGGIFDHIGLGFHRYSTDAKWLVPHFEKMLYDQALLMTAYTEAYQATGEPLMAQTARDIATYVLEQLTHPEGGFYCAQDADAAGQEGLFYLWTIPQVRAALDSADADLFIERFGLEQEGNYVDEVIGKRTGWNILHEAVSTQDLAERHSMSKDEVHRKLERARGLLEKEREGRPRPLRDEKILTDWNGLMIGALARAGAALDAPSLVDAATRAAQFIWGNLVTGGGLTHRYKDGHAAIEGMLDDYAFLSFGLIELYEAGFEEVWLERAAYLTNQTFELFGKAGGGLGMVSPRTELLAPPEDYYDGAIPSGAAVAFQSAVRLFHMTGLPHFRTRAAELSRVFSSHLNHAAEQHAFFLVGLDYALGPTAQIVIAAASEAKDEGQLIAATRKDYLPRKVVVVRHVGDAGAHLARIAPFTERQTAREGRATAYVCVDHTCEAFTHSGEEMMEKVKRRLQK